MQFVRGMCRVPVGDLGKLFSSLAPIGWIYLISSFVSGRGCCNLYAVRVAYLSAIWGNFLLRLLLLVGLIQSAALFQVAAVAICVRHVSRTCLFSSLAPVGWIDPNSSFLSGRGCYNLCAALVTNLLAVLENFASLAPVGWIDPISIFVSGRGCCNLCAARVAYLSFCFACSCWLD